MSAARFGRFEDRQFRPSLFFIANHAKNRAGNLAVGRGILKKEGRRPGLDAGEARLAGSQKVECRL